MTVLHLTNKLVEAIEPTAKAQTFTHDDLPGFTLLVTPAGAKTYYLVRKFESQVERTKLGRHPELTFAKAKSKAAKLRVQYDAGINPNEAKRQKRKELTLDQFFEVFYRDHCQIKNKRPEQQRANYRRAVSPVLGREKLSRINREDVSLLIHRIGTVDGHTRKANTIKALIRVIFNKAIAWEYFKEINPAVSVSSYPEKSRDRFLSREEMVQFHEALAQEPDDTLRDFFSVILMTGTRRSEALTMNWDDVHLQQPDPYWRIPDTKNGDPRILPISEPLHVLLTRRHRFYSDTSNWVFPGEGKTGHLVEYKNAWKRLLDRAGIENLRVHDLRRTLASWMLADGNDLTTIGKVLGHKDYQSTLIYARLNTESLRAPLEKTVANLAPDIRPLRAVK